VITIKGNPDGALHKLAKEILFALINREFGIILGKLSHEYGKWTKERLQGDVQKATNGRWVSEFMSFIATAAPVLSGDDTRYEYRHRLPVDGEWSGSCLVLRLHKKAPSLYALELVGFSQ
jgi:hypothetical protein